MTGSPDEFMDYDLDSLVDNHTKNRVMQIYTDNEHFIQDYLEQCPQVGLGKRLFFETHVHLYS